MSQNPRIEELRRRVQKDPASIAFAQLAEEYRRAGSYEDAIAACRTGLAIHPGYLSARVTLGRALLEVNDLDAAQAELEQTVNEISRAISPARPIPDDGLSFEQASADFLAALDDLPGGVEAALAP